MPCLTEPGCCQTLLESADYGEFWQEHRRPLVAIPCVCKWESNFWESFAIVTLINHNPDLAPKPHHTLIWPLKLTTPWTWPLNLTTTFIWPLSLATTFGMGWHFFVCGGWFPIPLGLLFWMTLHSLSHPNLIWSLKPNFNLFWPQFHHNFDLASKI